MKGAIVRGSALVAAAAILAIVAVGGGHAVSMAVAVLAGAAATFVRMPSRSARRRWSPTPVVVLAVALIGTPAWPGTAAVLAGALGAAAMTPARSQLAPGPANLTGSAVVFIGLHLLRPLGAVPLADAPRLHWRELALVLVLAAVWYVTECSLEALASPESRAARRYWFRRALRDWPVAIVAISAAVTLAVLWSHSIPWALLVALGPFAITLHLGGRLAHGRELADNTVRALGRLPEAAGLVQSGHAQSVADLAVAMGRLAGYVGPDLEELEVAAQLHDLGLLATTRPSVRESGFSSAEVATWGAHVMSKSQALRDAAPIVAGFREPFRIPGADPDPHLDPRAQIVQVACMVVERLEAGSSIDTAVEELYRYSLFQLDPHVISLVRGAALTADTVLDELTRSP
jgi:hypothetical protein